MLEILIIKGKEKKQILLLDEGKIVEYYDEDKMDNRNEGNIFIGVVKDILDGMEAAFVDIGTEKNSYIHLKDLLPKVDEKNPEEIKNMPKVHIKDVVKENDKVLVQVKKDSNELKGARISKHISIPSKYIVFMPDTNIITVSQKIEDEKEQERLIKLVKENITPNNGAVIRTSANGKTQEIIDDIKIIEEKWKKIKQRYESNKSDSPKLIFKSQDIVQKMLVDLSEEKIARIISNDKNELEEIQRYINTQKECQNIKTQLKTLEDLNQIYDFQSQISKIEKRKIWLKCGGFITIDQTEALTAIDVNTGKCTEGKNFTDIIFKVNEQATIEIAKQLRLRDIGGIIIIDYIDMLRNGDKEKIEKLLKECLREDRAKTQVEGFTKLDLMELTRKHICSHKKNNINEEQGDK